MYALRGDAQARIIACGNRPRSVSVPRHCTAWAGSCVRVHAHLRYHRGHHQGHRSSGSHRAAASHAITGGLPRDHGTKKKAAPLGSRLLGLILSD